MQHVHSHRAPTRYHASARHRAHSSASKRWLVKLGITAAVAAGATAAIAGPASAAPAVEVPTATIWGSTQSVGYGGTVEIWAKLTHPGTTSRINSLTTQLQQWTNKGWKTVATQRLGSTGYNGYKITPDMSRKYRLFFPGWKRNGKWVYGAAVSNSWGVTMVTPPGSALGNAVVAAAKAQVGKWYRYGAAGPSTFDCSGLTQYVYRKFGVSLPHSAAAQRRYGRAIPASQARAGDLIVFSEGGSWGHVGIYLGGGYMIDAPHSGAKVRVEKVWRDTVVYRRVVG